MSCGNCDKCKCPPKISDDVFEMLKDINTEFTRKNLNNPLISTKQHCQVCKLEFEGVTHYACMHPNCPHRITC